MKLTKKIQAEIVEDYTAYWDAYLEGDMKLVASFMDDHIMLIGSGNGEFFKNKKEAIEYYTKTADQISGKAEMRNRKIDVSPAGKDVLVSEENDFFVLIDSVWTFYAPGRFSTLFSKFGDKWKIVHQHGSMPDGRTDGGQQVNTDPIKVENVKLKEAIKRRTLELEEKNRELEIESTLERVRARSLAMQSSDELLETSDVMLAEITKLNIHALRIGICTINAKTEAAEIWSRSETKKKVEDKILGVVPKGVSSVFDKMVKAWKQKKPFYASTRKGKEVGDYYKKVSEYLSYPLPAKYNAAETLSSFFFPEGALNVISLLPLDENENQDNAAVCECFWTGVSSLSRFAESRSAGKGSRDRISIGKGKSKNHGHAEFRRTGRRGLCTL